MVISSSIVLIKLASGLAKEMVFSEATATLVPKLYQASKQWIVNSMSAAAEATAASQPDHLASTSATKTTSIESQPTADGQQQQQTGGQPESTEYLVHNWLEAMFAWFQVIILWHEPYVSFKALSGLLSSFLLLTYFAPRFYATIMIALFIYHANKFWFGHVWPAIRVPPERGREEEMRLDVDRWTYLHPQLMTLAELGQITNNLIKSSETQLKQLMLLRQEKPAAFCLLICSILTCTAYIGNRISGSSLLFLSTAALVLAPGIYLHLMPESVKEWMKQNMGLRICKLILLQTSSCDEQSQAEETTALTSTEHQSPTAASNASEAITFSGLVKKAAGSTDASALLAAVDSLPLFQHFKRKKQQLEEEDEDDEEEEEEEEEGGQGEPAKNLDEIGLNDNSQSSAEQPEDDDQQDGFVLL